MEFQWSCFKSWKMMLWKCCTQYASKFEKLSSGHRTGKCQFSFQSQRKAMPKNAQTTAQLHSSHTRVKECSKFSKPGFSNTWPWTSWCSSWFEKRQRNQRSTGSWKKQESSRKNIYFCLIDHAKAFDCVDHNKLWKILKEMGIPDHLTCLLRYLHAYQEATVRTGHGTADGSK